MQDTFFSNIYRFISLTFYTNFKILKQKILQPKKDTRTRIKKIQNFEEIY